MLAVTVAARAVALRVEAEVAPTVARLVAHRPAVDPMVAALVATRPDPRDLSVVPSAVVAVAALAAAVALRPPVPSVAHSKDLSVARAVAAPEVVA